MFHWLSCLFTVVYPVYNQSLSIQIFCHAVKPNYSALQLKTNSSCKKKNVQFRLPYFVIKNRHDATFLSLQQKSSIVDFNCSSYLLVVNAPGSCALIRLFLLEPHVVPNSSILDLDDVVALYLSPAYVVQWLSGPLILRSRRQQIHSLVAPA